MIHKLARTHYFPFEEKAYPISQVQEDESVSYLNLNINNLSHSSYRLYPQLKNDRLARKYLHALSVLSHASLERVPLAEDNLLFSQGSAEAIDLIIRVFCEPGKDAVMITSPTFSYYAYRAALENVSVVDVPLEGPDLNVLNVGEILNQPAKVLFLASPNNPVGTLLDLKVVEEIVQRFRGIVVMDEAYIEWTSQSTCAGWVLKYDNLIILRTFSKMWGLAGVRCGVSIATKSAIDTLRLAQPMFSFPDSSAEIVMDKMNDVERLFGYKMRMDRYRVDFFDFLMKLEFVERVYPGEANFLLVKFRDEKKVQLHLLREKILVSSAAHQVPNTLRISIGSRVEMERVKNQLMEMSVNGPLKDRISA